MIKLSALICFLIVSSVATVDPGPRRDERYERRRAQGEGGESRYVAFGYESNKPPQDDVNITSGGFGMRLGNGGLQFSRNGQPINIGSPRPDMRHLNPIDDMSRYLGHGDVTSRMAIHPPNSGHGAAALMPNGLMETMDDMQISFVPIVDKRPKGDLVLKLFSENQPRVDEYFKKIRENFERISATANSFERIAVVSLPYFNRSVMASGSDFDQAMPFIGQHYILHDIAMTESVKDIHKYYEKFEDQKNELERNKERFFEARAPAAATFKIVANIRKRDGLYQKYYAQVQDGSFDPISFQSEFRDALYRNVDDAHFDIQDFTELINFDMQGEMIQLISYFLEKLMRQIDDLRASFSSQFRMLLPEGTSANEFDICELLRSKIPPLDEFGHERILTITLRIVMDIIKKKNVRVADFTEQDMLKHYPVAKLDTYYTSNISATDAFTCLLNDTDFIVGEAERFFYNLNISLLNHRQTVENQEEAKMQRRRQIEEKARLERESSQGVSHPSSSSRSGGPCQ